MYAPSGRLHYSKGKLRLSERAEVNRTITRYPLPTPNYFSCIGIFTSPKGVQWLWISQRVVALLQRLLLPIQEKLSYR